VQVEALNAAEVTMTVDDGLPVTLAASGANSYAGSIEIYGESMNGNHVVLITASNSGLTDTQPAWFHVEAPPAGQNIWLRTNDVPDSQTQAIAVDLLSNVYEVGTSGTGAEARLVVSKRDPSGNPAWPGSWLTFHDGESRGEDIAVGPDGLIYVLGNYQDKEDFTRWWLAKLDPAAGVLLDVQLGEVDEPARGLSVAPNGDIAIVGHATVWGQQDTPDVQVKIWVRPLTFEGVTVVWGYSPTPAKNLFTEIPEDIVILGDRIFVTGSAEGSWHPDAQDTKPRKRLFIIELNYKGQIVREYVAANQPSPRSGGYALATDGKGGIVTAGWACDDVCTQVGEILWFKGDGDLVPYARHTELGKGGPAYSLDIAYHPAGYNVVASAVSVGPDLNFALRVTGRKPQELNPVFAYLFDTLSIELGQAVAVGPHGYIWFAGLRLINKDIRAVVGRNHG
jgi:hypothetical protein